MTKVVICWPEMVGYMAACFRALAASPQIDLFVVAGRPSGFNPEIATGFKTRLLAPEEQDEKTIAEIVAAFDPDIVSLPGWGTPHYRNLAFLPELAKARFFMVMDTPRRDSWRQKLGGLRFRRYFSRIAKVATIGERAFQCARTLGFAESQINRGAMCGFDYDAFSQAHASRLRRPEGWPKRFLYTGRYHPNKAIDVLLEAYSLYRSSAPDPWPLATCGAGELAEAINRAPGVENLGFVQPADQPEVYAHHGVFVLASRFEPWALVIAEACAAGLPVICTEACGAAVELVRPHFNGLTVPSNDPKALARAFRHMHDNYSALPEMGGRGMALAAPFAADVWARRWIEMIEEFRPLTINEPTPFSAPLAEASLT
jgi:glycosyltransferase involved in cell wall biosynthesis